MSGFVLHPEAYADLDEIWEYIANDNLDAADRVLDEIYQTVRSLLAFPRQGHARPDLSTKPLRFHPVRDYVIAYAANEDPLKENSHSRRSSFRGLRQRKRPRCFRNVAFI